MITTRNTPMKSYRNKQIFQDAVRLLLGGILGATAYIVTAILVIEQSAVDYDLGFIRHVIDVSLFPAGILFWFAVPEDSIYYLPGIYGLSSLPYAVLGALVALRANAIIIWLVLLLITFFLCVSWLLAGIFAAGMPT
jgi:hypothetical protein